MHSPVRRTLLGSHGSLAPYDYCGLFRRKRIEELSFMLSGLTKQLNPFSHRLLGIRIACIEKDCTLSFIDFVDWLFVK